MYLTEQEAQEAGDGTAEAQEFVDEGVFYWAGGVARAADRQLVRRWCPPEVARLRLGETDAIDEEPTGSTG